MMIDYRKAWLATAIFGLLTGCAANPKREPEGKAGYVTEFYSVDKLRNTPPHCLSKLSAAQIEAGTYAEIMIRRGRSSRYVSALVPPSIKPALHDKVEISPSYCKEGGLPVVRQILSSSTPPTGRVIAEPLPESKK